jgi:hypothetical protein
LKPGSRGTAKIRI